MTENWPLPELHQNCFFPHFFLTPLAARELVVSTERFSRDFYKTKPAGYSHAVFRPFMHFTDNFTITPVKKEVLVLKNLH